MTLSYEIRRSCGGHCHHHSEGFNGLLYRSHPFRDMDTLKDIEGDFCFRIVIYTMSEFSVVSLQTRPCSHLRYKILHPPRVLLQASFNLLFNVSSVWSTVLSFSFSSLRILTAAAAKPIEIAKIGSRRLKWGCISTDEFCERWTYFEMM